MKPLLPPGCYDILPPLARLDSVISSKLLDFFISYGYEQVAPPLLEYSDHLLHGRGAELSSQMFRVMDPTAQRVMAIRPDITLQIARIANKQLRQAPRPLRLCYNGLILRLQNDEFKHNRQLRQTGIELIGANTPHADAEVILLAARAVAHLGIRECTIDLNLPGIVACLIAQETLTAEQIQSLYAAISHKDSTAVAGFSLRYREALVALLEHVGEAEMVLRALQRLDLPAQTRALCNELQTVVDLVRQQQPAGCQLTVDVTERQGYSYHSGVGFTLFFPGVAHEAGRGGRYHAGEESATGFTLYIESLRPLLPPLPVAKKLLVPAATTQAECEALHQQGYVTLYALDTRTEMREQATRLGCVGFLQQGQIVS